MSGFNVSIQKENGLSPLQIVLVKHQNMHCSGFIMDSKQYFNIFWINKDKTNQCMLYSLRVSGVAKHSVGLYWLCCKIEAHIEQRHTGLYNYYNASMHLIRELWGQWQVSVLGKWSKIFSNEVGPNIHKYSIVWSHVVWEGKYASEQRAVPWHPLGSLSIFDVPPPHPTPVPVPSSPSLEAPLSSHNSMELLSIMMIIISSLVRWPILQQDML